jgi:AraC family transcriptional regulator
MYFFSTENASSLKPLPVQSNILNYSVLKNLEVQFPIRRFAIKYVVSGTEAYVINDNHYKVSAGSYLLANRFSKGKVYVESKEPVKGICIDIAPDLISQAVASFVRPDTCFTDSDLDVFFNSTSFLENQYQSQHTLLGKDLRALEQQLSSQPEKPRVIAEDLFYTLAEHIVSDHIPIYKQLQQVPAIKQHTKKELYRRVLIAKNYMHETFITSPTIQQIARHCNLSEFHFFRLFKQVFGVTPHHYIIRLKLQHAAVLLNEPGISIAETAALSGFSDVFTFSKSFKKYYGKTPGSWKSV